MITQLNPQMIEVDGYPVHHVESGEGQPVILLHGLGGSWEDWLEQIAALSPAYRVCAIDLPGFGKSPPPERVGPEYTLSYVADFVRKLMDAKGYPDAILIGNSMGGGITLRCAIDFPERVRAFVLANGVGLGKEISGFNRLMAFPGMARLFVPFVTRDTVVKIWQSLFYDQAKFTAEMVERTWEWIRKDETKKFLIQLYPRSLSIWGQKYVLLEELSKVQCPGLITWGINDEVVPVMQAIRGYQRMEKAQLRLLRACGHAPQIEQAGSFNQETLRFIKVVASSQILPGPPAGSHRCPARRRPGRRW